LNVIRSIGISYIGRALWGERRAVMGEEKVAVKISRRLYEQVKKHVEESGGEFKSVEEFVEFVLEEVLREEEEEPVYTPEEEEEIKRRLRALGYL